MICAVYKYCNITLHYIIELINSKLKTLELIDSKVETPEKKVSEKFNQDVALTRENE